VHRRTVAAFAATVSATIPAFGTITPITPAVAQIAPWFRIGQQIAPLGEVENLALV
jgi:hypothetical protein